MNAAMDLIALFSDPATWAALITLIVLEVVLGIDNLVFIAILSNKLPPEQQQRARRIGLTLALGSHLLQRFMVQLPPSRITPRRRAPPSRAGRCRPA